MRKTILAFTLFFIFNSIVYGQSSPINFSAKYIIKGKDTCCIKIEVISSSKRVLYYMIGLSGIVDTGCVHLVGDIDAIGTNEYLALQPITANKRVIKYLSIKKIHSLSYEYYYEKINALQFFLVYYNKPDFQSN